MLRHVALLFLVALPWTCARADSYVGNWFRLSGLWTGSELAVESIDWREPYKEASRGQIQGALDRIDAARRLLEMGPFRIEWSQATRFEGVAAGELKPGDSLRVYVQREGDALLANAVELRRSPSGRALQVTALATGAERGADGSVRLTLLGVPAVVAQSGYNQSRSLTRRQDSRRPDQPFSVPLWQRPLTLGGEYVAGALYRKNLRLERAKRDERLELDQELKLEAFYPWSETTAIFLSAKAVYEAELYRRGGSREVEKELARDQMWVYWGRLGGSGLSLQAGRQNIAEEREWWWDDDLDALRLYYDAGPWHFQLAGARELARESSAQHGIAPEKEDLYRLLGRAAWLWAPRQRLELFALKQNDRSQRQPVGALVGREREDASDANLAWFGVRALGDRRVGDYGDLKYWADFGWVRGSERVFGFEDAPDNQSVVEKAKQQRVRGSALDVGASWTLPMKWEPTLTLGYARGSGGSGDGVDRAYRQTGLHANKWRFRGVNRFRYYGELLRPELSNLGITTLALGFPLLENSSLEMVYHRYRQVEAGDQLRDARISADPSGDSRDIGREFDLVLGFRESRRLELAFIASAFRGGQAYVSQPDRSAYQLLFELTYNF